MKKIVAVLVASLMVPAMAMAQGHGHGNGHGNGEGHGKGKDHDHDRDGRDNVVVVQRPATRTVIVNQPTNRVVTREARGGSPAFCRSGAGHPKFGRAWCIDKGFGLGNNGWQRTSWDNVVFQNARTPTIGDVLSSVILNRLSSYANNTLGLRTPLVGNWVTSETGSRVYLVNSGSTRVAELVDTNGDGRADYVLLHRR